MSATTCADVACDRPRYRDRRFCRTHADARRQRGSQPQGLSTEERFWAKVAKCGPDECWLWTAGRNGRGYGHFTVRSVHRGESASGAFMEAHRFSYALHYGDLAPGVVVRHRCDTKLCVNPAHLEPGTQGDNVRDALERGQWNWLVSPEQVREVRRLAESGARTGLISKAVGVSPAHIRKIVRGVTRQEVTP